MCACASKRLYYSFQISKNWTKTRSEIFRILQTSASLLCTYLHKYRHGVAEKTSTNSPSVKNEKNTGTICTSAIRILVEINWSVMRSRAYVSDAPPPDWQLSPNTHSQTPKVLFIYFYSVRTISMISIVSFSSESHTQTPPVHVNPGITRVCVPTKCVCSRLSADYTPAALVNRRIGAYNILVAYPL